MAGPSVRDDEAGAEQIGLGRKILIGLLLVLFFPEIALWLPSVLGGLI